MRKLTQNIVGSWSKSDFDLINQSDTVNMYVDKNGQQEYLRSIKGSSILVDIDGENKPCRGMFVSSRGYNDTPILYVVFGSSLYCVYTDKIGNIKYNRLYDSLSENLDKVCFCENGGQTKETAYVFLVDGVNVYCIPNRLDPREQQDKIFKPNLPITVESKMTIRPTHCAYLYNYLVVNDSNTDAFYISYQYPLEQRLPKYDSTGTVIVDKDGNIVYEEDISTDIFQVDYGHLYYQTGFITYSEWKPDITTALISNGTYLYTFGPESTQIFNYTSEVDSPFKSPTNGANGIGCKAPNSVVNNSDYIFFLGSASIGNNGIYQYVNNTLTKISTTVLERYINDLKDITDGIGQSWVEDGHLFYSITFNRANKTFVYDVTTGLWSRRESNGNKWNLSNSIQWNNLTCFGTYDGVICYLDSNKNTQYDNSPIVRKRTSGAMITDRQLFSIDELRLFIDTNRQHGKVSVRYRYSDGNWSSYETIDTGTDHLNKLSIWNLGVSDMFTVETVYSDDTPFAILGGEVKYSIIDS